MNINILLKICKVQELDLYFTSNGFTRKYIYQAFIAPNFYISKATYYNYLKFNAKHLLNKKFGIDWRESLHKNTPKDYIKLMTSIHK